MDIDERLQQARALVIALEAGNETEASQILEGLTNRQGNELFLELGRLTRELHEAINDFVNDSRIADLAEREMPDASERLNYVISMTERSANTSLNAVEASLPLANELGCKADALFSDWTRFRERQLPIEEFRVLSHELGDFLQTVTGHAGQLHSKLSEVLMAQDFQDLTGQIIRQVIKLIHDVESKLVQLVRISGSQLPEKKKEPSKLEGPVIPGVDQGDVLGGQDDVDDLLSSLGF
jgi:chemotaxis protein CheZ